MFASRSLFSALLHVSRGFCDFNCDAFLSVVVVTTRVNVVAVADVSSLFAYYMRSVINFTHLTRAQLQYLHSSRTLAGGVQTASKKIGKSKEIVFLPERSADLCCCYSLGVRDHSP